MIEKEQFWLLPAIVLFVKTIHWTGINRVIFYVVALCQNSISFRLFLYRYKKYNRFLQDLFTPEASLPLARDEGLK